jgi:hypothetical protein
MLDPKTIQEMGSHRFDEIQQAARLDHEAGPLLKPVTILIVQAVTSARRFLNRAIVTTPRPAAGDQDVSLKETG